MRKIIYRSFQSTREFAQKLRLKNREQWQAYCKSGNNPEDIPASAGSIYKKDFKDWPDFLGYNRIAKYTENNTRPFEDARKFVRELKLKGTSAWKEYCKSGKKPNDIHSAPQILYKKEWTNWGDFLGTGTIANQNKSQNYLPWPEAQKEYQRLAKENGLENGSDWTEFSLKHKKELEKINLPSNPKLIYTKERVWKKLKND